MAHQTLYRVRIPNKALAEAINFVNGKLGGHLIDSTLRLNHDPECGLLLGLRTRIGNTIPCDLICGDDVGTGPAVTLQIDDVVGLLVSFRNNPQEAYDLLLDTATGRVAYDKGKELETMADADCIKRNNGAPLTVTECTTPLLMRHDAFAADGKPQFVYRDNIDVMLSVVQPAGAKLQLYGTEPNLRTVLDVRQAVAETFGMQKLTDEVIANKVAAWQKACAAAEAAKTVEATAGAAAPAPVVHQHAPAAATTAVAATSTSQEGTAAPADGNTPPDYVVPAKQKRTRKPKLAPPPADPAVAPAPVVPETPVAPVQQLAPAQTTPTPTTAAPVAPAAVPPAVQAAPARNGVDVTSEPAAQSEVVAEAAIADGSVSGAQDNKHLFAKLRDSLRLLNLQTNYVVKQLDELEARCTQTQNVDELRKQIRAELIAALSNAG